LKRKSLSGFRPQTMSPPGRAAKAARMDCSQGVTCPDICLKPKRLRFSVTHPDICKKIYFPSQISIAVALPHLRRRPLRPTGGGAPGWHWKVSRSGRRFTVGALAVVRYAKLHGTEHRPWLVALLARAADQGRLHCACQQDCSDGVGNDGQGRSATKNPPQRSRPGIWRDVTVGKGKQHVKQSRSIRRSGQPTRARALSNARS
jgi:hypothetical protein